MSGLCIFNLKQHNLEPKDKQELSKRIVDLVLKNNLGVCFNSNDYGEKIINEARMHDYFHISSNFFYRNCDFLDIQPLMLQICGAESFEEIDFDNLPNKDMLKMAFNEKYKIFKDLINCIFEFNVALIEIFITNNYGPVLFYNDFDSIYSSRDHFLDDLFGTLRDELCNNFNYEFSDVKFEINNR